MSKLEKKSKKFKSKFFKIINNNIQTSYFVNQFFGLKVKKFQISKTKSND